MSYPVGVLTRTVVLPVLSDFGGNLTNATLTIVPSVSLKWTATGQILLANPVSAVVVNGSASLTLPIIQAGFTTKENVRLDAWKYTASVSVPVGGASIPDIDFILPYGSSEYVLDFAAPTEIVGSVVTLIETVYEGTKGDDGTPGVGVPVGGTSGQVLSKATVTDYDTAWIDPPAGTGGGGGTTITYTNLLVLGPTEPIPNTTAVGTVIARRIS